MSTNAPSLEQRAVARGRATVVQAGGDVITGDVFVGRFARLRDVWIDPAPVFDEVEVGRFVGRRWLVDEVDRHLARRERGYVVIQADAGLGKTMFAAWLARTRDLPCHFTRRRKGRVATTALRNLAVQLIARYNLAEQFAPGGMLPETAGEPGWFDQVLAASARAAQAAGQQVVLVVDGLDEAENVDGDLPLGLPAVLPRGVHVIATCRTGTNLPALRQPYKAVGFDAADARNMGDVREYLHAAAGQDPEISRLLDENGLQAGAFVEQIFQRCGGMWVYIRYVLDELRLGLRGPGELNRLPSDLAGFYAESLVPRDPGPSWAAFQLPLLAVLGAAAEPLSADALASLAGLPDPHAVEEWCLGPGRPFLSAVSGDHERRYGIYHASLREFLQGEQELPLDGHRARSWQLARATHRAHQRIAEHYLEEFGGLDGRLPLLAADPALARRHNGYPLRYLAHHLEQGRHHDRLDALLACEHAAGGQVRNVWHTAHEEAGTLGDYLSDLARARRLAADEVDASLRAGRAAPSFGRELRYSIMTAAIGTLTGNVPSELVSALVGAGIWSPARGLAHAEHLQQPFDRTFTFLALLPRLSGEDHARAVAGAVTAARQVEDAYQRSLAIRAVLAGDVPVPRDLGSAALDAIAEIDDESDRAEELIAVAGHLVPESVPIAVELAGAIEAEDDRVRALAAFFPYMPDEQLATMLSEARNITGGYVQAWFVQRLVPHLPAGAQGSVAAFARGLPGADNRAWILATVAERTPEDVELVTEALTEARATAEPFDRAWALAHLLALSAEPDRSPLVAEARAAARAVTAPDDQAWALSFVAGELTGGPRADLAAEMLDLARPVRTSQERASILRAVAALLDDEEPAGGVDRALVSAGMEVARSLETEEERVDAFVRLSPYFDEAHCDAALDVLRAIEDEHLRVQGLHALVGRLPDTRVGDLLNEASRLSDTYARSSLVDGLAPRLRGASLGEALAIVQSITDDYGRAQLLGRLSRHLEPPERAAVLDRALTAARAITRGRDRVTVIVLLAEEFAPPDREALYAEAMSIVDGLPEDDDLVYLLRRLQRHLPEPLRESAALRAIELARRVDLMEAERAWTLSEIALFSPEPRRGELIAEAVESARRVVDERLRAGVLAELGVHLVAGERARLLGEAKAAVLGAGGRRNLAFRVAAQALRLLPESAIVKLLAVVRPVMRQPGRVDALPEIVRHVPELLIREGMRALKTFLLPFHRAHVFGTVALHLPEPGRTEALEIAMAAPRRAGARRALLTQATLLWPALPGVEEMTVLRRCLEGVDLDDCLTILSDGVDLIARIGGPEAVRECLGVVSAVQRWWPYSSAATAGEG
jgi:hypothetical protein